ncbi:MAG: O-antigen ligase family protein [Pseudomonadota bacterium]
MTPPTLPLPVSLMATVFLFILLVLTLRQTRGIAARFIISALWLRFIMSAFHQYTYDPLVAGLSGNALGSITVTVFGLLVLRPRYWSLKILLPVYSIIGLVLLSAFVNGAPASALNTIVKYLYFIVILVGIYQALRENEASRFTLALLSAFTPLFIFFVLSLVLGVVKQSEADGSASYIGGYYHEAAFSIALLGAFFVLSLQSKWSLLWKITALALAAAAIYLANYRTSILALVPLAFYGFAGESVKHVLPRQRALVGIAAVAAALAVLIALGATVSDRFSDVAAFASAPERYIKPPQDFTREDMRLMSSRAYIWSTYFYSWAEAGPVQQLFGFGPDSWQDLMLVYPHNTLLAALFELGVFGVVMMLLFWASMFGVALRIKRDVRWQFILAHGAFFILNMATMALWQIEGIIFYALICGYSLHYALIPRPMPLASLAFQQSRPAVQ